MPTAGHRRPVRRRETPAPLYAGTVRGSEPEHELYSRFARCCDGRGETSRRHHGNPPPANEPSRRVQRPLVLAFAISLEDVLQAILLHTPACYAAPKNSRTYLRVCDTQNLSAW